MPFWQKANENGKSTAAHKKRDLAEVPFEKKKRKRFIYSANGFAYTAAPFHPAAGQSVPNPPLSRFLQEHFAFSVKTGKPANPPNPFRACALKASSFKSFLSKALRIPRFSPADFDKGFDRLLIIGVAFQKRQDFFARFGGLNLLFLSQQPPDLTLEALPIDRFAQASLQPASRAFNRRLSGRKLSWPESAFFD
jgi:hypothetical protein